jgi:preprotein translocase subunit SecG
MEAVIIVIHLMVIVALIAVVLLQRSEGGALGIGSSNAFLSSRGQGNVLTRATTILGIAFFLTSVALTVLTRLQPPPAAILNQVPTAVVPPLNAPATPAVPGSTAGTLNLSPTPLVPGPSTAPVAPLGTPAPAPAPVPVAPAPAAPSVVPATPAPAAPATPAPAAPAQ